MFGIVETRSKTRAIHLNIDLADLLAAEEAERFQRLEEGYESEDSLAGDHDDDDDEHPLDAEFSGHSRAVENDRLHEFSEILDGILSDITDSETESPPSMTNTPFTLNISSSTTSISTSSLCQHSNPPVPAKPVNTRRKAYKNDYKKSLRNAKRQKTTEGPYSKAIGQNRVDDSEVVVLDVDATELPVASTGYQGIRSGKKFSSWTREKVFQNLRYIDWDGT